MDGNSNVQVTNESDVLDVLINDQLGDDVDNSNTDVDLDQDQQEDQAPTFDSYKVKHLDDEIVIDSVERQRELVQKGVDYDRIKTELDKQKSDLQNNKALKLLGNIAKNRNMSIDDVVAQMENEYTENNLKAFMGEHGITDIEAGKKLFEKIMGMEEENGSLSEIKKQREDEAEAKIKEEKEMAGLIRFVKNTTGKDLDPKAITDEMYEIAEKEGITLTEAYAQISLSKANENDKVNETNDQIKNSSVQDVTNSTGKAKTCKYSKAELEKMTELQLAKTGLPFDEIVRILDSE